MKHPQPNALLNFVRLFHREKPRDWATRWLVAGNSVKWEGAEKNHMRAYAWSPIWGALAQGWRDNIQRETDEVHPPFAYGSGMGWRDEKGNDYFAEDEDAPSKESEEASMEREIDIGEGIDFAKLILQM